MISAGIVPTEKQSSQLIFTLYIVGHSNCCYIARQVPYCPAKIEAAQRFELTAKKAIAERVKEYRRVWLIGADLKDSRVSCIEKTS